MKKQGDSGLDSGMESAVEITPLGMHAVPAEGARLKFFVQSQPKQCSECRRKRREHNRLNQELEKAIRSLDRRDVQQVAHLAGLYLLLGNKKKAMEFLGRARNLARKQGNSDLASQLDTLQTQVKDAPHSSI